MTTGGGPVLTHKKLATKQVSNKLPSDGREERTRADDSMRQAALLLLSVSPYGVTVGGTGARAYL